MPNGDTRGKYFDEVQRAQQAYAERLTSHAGQVAEVLRRSVEATGGMQAVAAQLAAQLSETRALLDAVPEQVTKSLRRASEQMAEAMRRSWERGIPPNLLPLEDEIVYRALAVSRESGPPMIWAPRPNIVERVVVGESFADRATVLAAHREEVLVDLERVLADAAASLTDEHRQLHKLAVAAVAAAGAKHDLAAQALAASAIGCLVHSIFGHSAFAAASKKMSARNVDEALLEQVKYFTLELATANAITRTNERPEGFNRHGTLHGDLAWYGEGEMLSGLLLVVGWDRELSWWASRQRDEAA
jgi:hypothetical protein